MLIRPARNRLALLLVLAIGAQVAHAQEKVLNLYSARHYQTDEALYANFTKATGIKHQPARRQGRRTG
jgi:iron(III) transport system substrate-binding protein